MPNPKTLKFYLKGDVLVDSVTYVTEEGELLTYEQYKKLVIPSKKNQQRAIANKATGRAYIVPSQQYIDWRKLMLPVFDEFYLQALEQGVNLPIVRCNINCIFYYADTRSRDNHNKFETIADMLVEAGIVADDEYKVFHETKMKGYCRKHKPATEIYITLITPDQKEYEWDLTDYTIFKEKQKAKRRIQKQIQRKKKKSKEQLVVK